MHNRRGIVQGFPVESRMVRGKLPGKCRPMLLALPGPRHRGVMGKSIGGYGAITLDMKHPETFGAIACHSGDMFFDFTYTRDFDPALRRIRKAGGAARPFDDGHMEISYRFDPSLPIIAAALAP